MHYIDVVSSLYYILVVIAFNLYPDACSEYRVLLVQLILLEYLSESSHY